MNCTASSRFWLLYIWYSPLSAFAWYSLIWLGSKVSIACTASDSSAALRDCTSARTLKSTASRYGSWRSCESFIQ
jgi:hypothetical protein